MLEFLSALFLWLTMITFANCQPFDGGFGSGFSSNMRLLDEDSLDMFNKTLASKSTSTMRNDVGNARTSKTPVIPPPPTSAKHPVQPILSDNIEGPLYPTSRGFITPPLPREHHNPFADKPTLRGSNSDNTVSNRRPQIPIPPPVPIYKSDKDRIPIKRPDLIAQSDNRKKTINTPSMQKLPEGLNYSEPSSSPSSTTHRTNDTYDVVIPNVHNISRVSVLRILNNDKKYEVGNNKPPRFEQTEQESSKASKTYLKEDPKNSVPSSKSVANNGSSGGAVSTTSSSLLPASTFKQQMAAASSSSSSFSSSVDDERRKEAVVYSSNSNNGGGDASGDPDVIFTEQQQVTQAKSADFNSAIKSVQESTEMNSMPDHPEPRARYILGIAWDIHVYLIAVLFAVLAGVSAFSLFRMRSLKWLLPYGYFFAVHVLLMTIGAIRSVYLFYDAYNISRSFSEPVSRLMLNVVFPFLVCVFSLMFVFILKIVDLKSDIYYARKSNVFMLLVVAYVLLSVSVDLYADFTPYSSSLILLSQCLYVFLCVVLGVTYIIFYKYANRSSLRKQNSVYGTAFTDPLRPSLAHAIRVMLATSLLSLLMAAIQVIGIFCIYDPFNKDQPHPWLWWAFQLSVRVIEVSICFLVFWAAVQPLRGEDEKETQSHNSASGFPLFPWGVNGTPRGSDHGGGNAADDIYPAICSTNQAIHNYTLRTGKQVYEDIFQFCNSSAPGSGPHLQPQLQPLPLPPPSSHHAHHHGSGPGGGGTVVTPVPTHLLHHTADRRSLKIHRHHPPPPPPPNSSHIGDVVDPASLHRHAAAASGMYTMYAADRRPPQPSPSMLIDEKGIVRFRSIADAELHTATAAATSADDTSFSRLHLNHPSNENYCSS
ncbi:uncharacterized protein LOC135832433 [Planococcus citri]|uniref:uncharacterized protein LOC135832433 n=1 Tax=Planococcus citri TaxID=170843 RepID=UPI0031F788E7